MSATFTLGGGWGNRIEFTDYGSRRVVGWKDPKPKVGDRLEAAMQSGRTGVYEFVRVEPLRDPPDMFFGVVKDVGFKDELDAALSKASPPSDRQEGGQA